MTSNYQWWEWFFVPLLPFVGHPERIAAVTLLWFVAAVLLSLWRKQFIAPPLVAGISWLLFAGWEWHCVQMGYTIRVDLFLIYPVLFALTLGGAIGTIFPGVLSQRIPNQFSLRKLLIVMTVIAVGLGILMWLSS